MVEPPKLQPFDIDKLGQEVGEVVFTPTQMDALTPIYRELLQLRDTHTMALWCVGVALTKGNENVKRGDLIASINDLAQAKVTAFDNYEELTAHVKEATPAIRKLLDLFDALDS